MITVCITGPQGSGKSRLASLILDAARMIGIQIRVFTSNTATIPVNWDWQEEK